MAAGEKRQRTLLDEVDALTQDRKHRHIVGREPVTVRLPPLLDALRTAARGAVGGGSSNASLPSERNMLDFAALYLYVQIDEQVTGWLRALGKPVERQDLGTNLRRWYTALQAQRLEPARERFYIDLLGRWAAEIRAKLEPPRERELPDACPLCGAAVWTGHDGLEYRHPLVIRYRPEGPTTIERARGVCRACRAVWPVRQLAWELEQARLAGQAVVEEDG